MWKKWSAVNTFWIHCIKGYSTIKSYCNFQNSNLTHQFKIWILIFYPSEMPRFGIRRIVMISLTHPKHVLSLYVTKEESSDLLKAVHQSQEMKMLSNTIKLRYCSVSGCNRKKKKLDLQKLCIAFLNIWALGMYGWSIFLIRCLSDWKIKFSFVLHISQQTVLWIILNCWCFKISHTEKYEVPSIMSWGNNTKIKKVTKKVK